MSNPIFTSIQKVTKIIIDVAKIYLYLVIIFIQIHYTKTPAHQRLESVLTKRLFKKIYTTSSNATQLIIPFQASCLSR